ncbi:uncharacterized protein EV422DRAFT_507785 [Fimicolochytrium jonesii]|uniref:uncharacterized protein n=1 Tax=Fimicolochytrium jonesii TaxID=1396493 RepID=UPI0022FF21A8|nr:uncharacterized protein EV422DRAFT_507785 [Fimicolochytrium jonesii]KAI8818968.1 hypothetical protein EV422DRAFT_507785 [Fimicolochytrium jonesii]
MSSAVKPAAHHERIPLSYTLAAEASAAFGAAALVAPIITIVDRSIFLNASGTQPLLAGLVSGFKTLFTNPLSLAKQPATLLMFGVYAGTYLTANTIQSVCDYEGWDWFYPKFIGTSIANVGLCVGKDATFTKWFGTGASKPVPWSSYGLYTTRDVMTVFASFNLPPVLAAEMTSSFGISKGTAEVAAQLITPCAVQFISTPLHLLGMDLYNRPDATPPQRRAQVQKEYAKSTAARIGRIFAAFGIGGVANQRFRYEAKELLRRSYLH